MESTHCVLLGRLSLADDSRGFATSARISLGGGLMDWGMQLWTVEG